VRQTGRVFPLILLLPDAFSVPFFFFLFFLFLLLLDRLLLVGGKGRVEVGDVLVAHLDLF
jgi:hypothetical protein